MELRCTRTLRPEMFKPSIRNILFSLKLPPIETPPSTLLTPPKPRQSSLASSSLPQSPPPNLEASSRLCSLAITVLNQARRHSLCQSLTIVIGPARFSMPSKVSGALSFARHVSSPDTPFDIPPFRFPPRDPSIALRSKIIATRGKGHCGRL